MVNAVASSPDQFEQNVAAQLAASVGPFTSPAQFDLTGVSGISTSPKIVEGTFRAFLRDGELSVTYAPDGGTTGVSYTPTGDQSINLTDRIAVERLGTAVANAFLESSLGRSHIQSVAGTHQEISTRKEILSEILASKVWDDSTKWTNPGNSHSLRATVSVKGKEYELMISQYPGRLVTFGEVSYQELNHSLSIQVGFMQSVPVGDEISTALAQNLYSRAATAFQKHQLGEREIAKVHAFTQLCGPLELAKLDELYALAQFANARTEVYGVLPDKTLFAVLKDGSSRTLVLNEGVAWITDRRASVESLGWGSRLDIDSVKGKLIIEGADGLTDTKYPKLGDQPLTTFDRKS